MENKQIEVIGVTNNPEYIGELLGVDNDSEYDLYQETPMGKYYAKRLADGTLKADKVVRLISDAQAAKLEAEVCALIERESDKIPELVASIPVIDTTAMKAGALKLADEMGARVRAAIGDVKMINVCK